MRYFIAFAVTLGLLFFLLFLLFHHGGHSKQPASRPLSSYATTDAQARLTIDGPINADQNHQSIQITVGQNTVNFQQLQGYQGNVVKSQTFANNENAYVNFLLALTYAGFTKGNNDPKLSDERGMCPLGDRYIFSFSQDGNTLGRYWATSCGGTKTYDGNLNLTITLFQAQVPNYNSLAAGAAL